MCKVLGFAAQTEDFRVEYEIKVLEHDGIHSSQKHERIENEIQELESQLLERTEKAEGINRSIESLTNHSDKIDYSIATACGLLTGLVDAFFVGELDLANCHEIGGEKINRLVKMAGGSENLEKAIKNLEGKTKDFFPSDPNINDFGGGLQHHLRDFAHHPTPTGLVFSLLTQFTHQCYGTDVSGRLIVVPVKDMERIGDTIGKKLLFGTWYWFLHMVSDVAGSSGSPGKGTGLPGPMLSLVKELSMLPFIRNGKIGDYSISQFISKLFNGTLFAKRDESGKIIRETVTPIDLRAEIGIIKTQKIPVLLNEVLVRSFYSIRRFCIEMHDKRIAAFSDLQKLDLRKIAPGANRTVERMITIASGAFVAADLTDAVVRSAVEAKSKESPEEIAVTFVTGLILRVNYVGIGRYTIALFTDAAMGKKLSRKRNEQIRICSEMMQITSAKLYYKDADMWVTAADTGEVIGRIYDLIPQTTRTLLNAWNDIMNTMERINEPLRGIAQNDAEFKAELLEILEG